MIQSKIKPVIVRLRKMRLRYSLQNMKMGEFYTVICYDMKRLLVTNQKADRTFLMFWKDAELYRSELMVDQASSLDVGDIQALRRALRRLTSAIPSLTKK